MSLRKIAPTGFASEHTVEYAVVSAAQRAFQQHHVRCCPIFFWKSREGNSLSMDIHANVLGKLVAIFPRRPKVTTPNTARVFWKINAQLHSFAVEAKSHRILSFAAMPLSSNLISLAAPEQIYWYQLGAVGFDEHFESTDCTGASFLSSSAFAESVLTETPDLQWKAMAAAMDELRWATGNGVGWMNFGGYKPVYLMIG